MVADALESELDALGVDDLGGHRLVRSIRELLARIAEDRPLVLALDDLHWADPASLDVVCHLLHRGPQGAVLLLLASRPAQTEPRLMTALEESERHELGHRIDLAPLSAEAAGQLLGDDVAPAARAALYRESGGNPFYLQQLAGAAHRARGRRAPEGGGAEPGLPSAVAASIKQEIDALPERTRQVLQAAAVVGDPFDPDLTAATAEISERDTLTPLDELLERDLVRPFEPPRRFRFRHPIVRRAVYESAGAGWRLAAHGRAAAALEARDAPAAAYAHHVERSASVGDEPAIAILTRAGEDTAARTPASAARWFGAALRLIPERDDNLERRLGLLAQRATALGLVGNLEETRDVLRSYLRLAPRDSSPLRLEVVVLAASAEDVTGHQEEARALVLDELATLDDQRSAEAGELNRVLAFSHFPDADWAAVRRSARAAVDSECAGMVRVGALSALAIAEHGLRDQPAAARAASEAAALFDRLSDKGVGVRQATLAGWLGWLSRWYESLVRRALARAWWVIALTVFVAAVGVLFYFRLDTGFLPEMDEGAFVLDISTTNDRRPAMVGLYVTQAQALLHRGRIDELAAVVDSAVEKALLSTSNIFLCWALTQKCLLEFLRGDLFAAVRLGERSVSLRAASRSPLARVADIELADALLEIGEPARCRAQLTDDDGRLTVGGFPIYEPRCYELLTRTELALGNPDRAAGFAARAQELARQMGLGFPLAHALRAQGLVELESGRTGDAAELAFDSVRAGDEAGAPIETARGRILAGRALAAAGDRRGAVRELQQAHDELTACGAVLYRDHAAHELRLLGHVAARPRAAANGTRVGGLTDRELEVIERLAAGRTNREIADELVLSVRTVDRHVARIFEKLGVNSRAAAASQFERARTELGNAVG